MSKAKPGELYQWVLAALDAETDDCILWPFAKNEYTGYAGFTLKGVQHAMHVFVCRSAHGPKPTPKHDAAHRCGNRICANKRHVRWATRQENIDDMLAHGTRKYGEDHQSAKLTLEQVREIRRLRAGGALLRELAAQFGMSRGGIYHITSGDRWRTQ